MIKARLGSLYKNEFDFDGNMDDTKPDYLFRVVHTNEEFKLKSHANCSARITNLLVRMIIDLKVPIFENEDGNFERLNGPMHLGLPNSTDDQNFAERLYYWTTESMLIPFPPHEDFVSNQRSRQPGQILVSFGLLRQTYV